MNNQLKIIEKEFDNSKIRTVWDKEQEKYFISVVDIVAVLTESDNPRNYRKVLKQKIAQEKIDKLKSQDMQYTFKPLIYTQKNNKYMKNINSNDFYKRARQFEERKETHLEKIKTTIVDPEEGEYIFKPKITKKAQHIKKNSIFAP